MNYTPQVGDRIQGKGWGDEYLDVLAVYGDEMWCLEQPGTTDTYDLDGGWIKVTPRPELPPMPDKWASVHTIVTISPLWDTADEALDGDAIAAVRYTATDDIVYRDEVTP